MYSSYSLSKLLVLVYILAIQRFLIRSVSSMNLTNAYLNHKCNVNEGKYKPGSEYEENFKHVIKFVSTNKFLDGFISMSYGEAPNAVAIRFQCRGDSYGSKCRSCYGTAVAGLRRRCQGNKAGTIWYDQCFLDISTIKFPNPTKIDYNNTFSMHNPHNLSGDIASFNKKMKDFLTKLVLKSIIPDGDNLVYYAAGEERFGVKKLYAMVQCIKRTVNCKECLEWSIKELSKCCDGKEGARLFVGRTCNLRYEIYPFLRT